MWQLSDILEKFTSKKDCAKSVWLSFFFPFKGNSATNISTNHLCAGNIQVPQGEEKVFFCKPKAYGRYVSISLSGVNEYVTICEVEVYPTYISSKFMYIFSLTALVAHSVSSVFYCNSIPIKTYTVTSSENVNKKRNIFTFSFCYSDDKAIKRDLTTLSSRIHRWVWLLLSVSLVFTVFYFWVTLLNHASEHGLTASPKQI